MTPTSYNPPTSSSDPRVCGHCRKMMLPWLEDRFPIKNDRTGKYHSGGDWGKTDCGLDATDDHWLWPL